MTKTEEFRKKLAQTFFYQKFTPSSDPLAYNLRWEDIPFDGCESSEEFYRIADIVLATCKKAGLKFVDEDAEMPENPYCVISGRTFDNACDDWDIPIVIEGSNYRGYDIAQQNMKGWVQVKEIEV